MGDEREPGRKAPGTPDDERARQAAARHAAQLVQNGMLLGLGSGRAASAAIRFVGERMREEGIRIQGIPASDASRQLALELGIPLREPDFEFRLDLTLDGADEVDPDLNVIKGGGGAHVREKLLARASDRLVLMVEEPKLVHHLGTRRVPVAVVPYAWMNTARRLERHCRSLCLRKVAETPFRTNDGLYLLDLDTGPIDEPAALESRIRSEVGVVEVGLFCGLCDLLVVGRADGEVFERPRAWQEPG